jgi:hypothetical protein
LYIVLINKNKVMAGILSNEQEKVLAGKLDDLVKLKGVLELIDGYVFKALLTFLDDNLVAKLGEPIKVKLGELATVLLTAPVDVDKAETIASDIINGLVDIPGLDEDAEGLLFKGIIEVIVGAVVKYLEGIKGTKVILVKAV